MSAPFPDSSSRALSFMIPLLFVVAFVTASAQGQTTSGPRADHPITAETIYDHEAAWPDIVALVADLAPSSLARGQRGVLIRVLPTGRARIDFGRRGVHEVPIAVTDLVERANHVRTGERFKGTPNFLLQIGTRLVDTRAAAPAPLESVVLARHQRFLCVFADPARDDLAQLAQSVEEHASRIDARTIFFPQHVARGELATVHARLRAIAWMPALAYPELVADYTQALLEATPDEPTWLLVTAEGRELDRKRWLDPNGWTAASPSPRNPG